MLYITPCACTRATVKKRGTYAAMHKYYRNIFSANKQNRDAQTRERGRSAVFKVDSPAQVICGCEHIKELKPTPRNRALTSCENLAIATMAITRGKCIVSHKHHISSSLYCA
jgi:hypothetical protein